MTPSQVASAGFLFVLLFAAPFSLRAAEPLPEKEDSKWPEETEKPEVGVAVIRAHVHAF